MLLFRYIRDEYNLENGNKSKGISFRWLDYTLLKILFCSLSKKQNILQK